MRVGVLSLTRDRLAYSQHCFQTLRENAGCSFDWFVLDQGSQDGTPEWLAEQDDMDVTYLAENVGIARGLNMLLDKMNTVDYDVIAHIDNDAEFTQPNTLRDLSELVYEGEAILSPRILGLNNPPIPTRELRIGDEIILDIEQIGGICLTAPASWYDWYRYPAEELPLWGLDDSHICAAFRMNGGTCGYVKRLEAWHFEGTDGQHERFPSYFERRVLEGGPV